jgi:hypothetical protein
VHAGTGTIGTAGAVYLKMAFENHLLGLCSTVADVVRLHYLLATARKSVLATLGAFDRPQFNKAVHVRFVLGE